MTGSVATGSAEYPLFDGRVCQSETTAGEKHNHIDYAGTLKRGLLHPTFYWQLKHGGATRDIHGCHIYIIHCLRRWKSNLHQLNIFSNCIKPFIYLLNVFIKRTYKFIQNILLTFHKIHTLPCMNIHCNNNIANIYNYGLSLSLKSDTMSVYYLFSFYYEMILCSRINTFRFFAQFTFLSSVLKGFYLLAINVFVLLLRCFPIPGCVRVCSSTMQWKTSAKPLQRIDMWMLPSCWNR